jgi:hypothetical protein
VALTRAQALLVVVGNPNVLASDRYWAAFLRLCYRHNGACREGTAGGVYARLAHMPRMGRVRDVCLYYVSM